MGVGERSEQGGSPPLVFMNKHTFVIDSLTLKTFDEFSSMVMVLFQSWKQSDWWNGEIWAFKQAFFIALGESIEGEEPLGNNLRFQIGTVYSTVILILSMNTTNLSFVDPYNYIILNNQQSNEY